MRARRNGAIRVLVLISLAVVLGLSLVPGTATARPCGIGEWHEVCVVNHGIVDYCVDTTPNDGTNCGGLLKIINVDW